MPETTLPAVPGYADLEPVGSGGFSNVFRAHQERFDRTVALKVLDVEMLDVETQRRFENECQIAGRISRHPNIVTVLDSGFTEEGQPYITSEFVAKGSLGDRLHREGTLPVADVLAIGIKMCGALAAAHDAGITHRDVKPDNILLSEYGEVELADFGISVAADQLDEGDGTVALTPVHAAPELFTGTPASPQSDIYALGSTLYELLVGRAPFESTRSSDDLATQIRRIQVEEVPEPKSPKLPAAVLGALRKSMAKDPADRYATAVAFGEALRGVEAALHYTQTKLPLASDEARISGGVAQTQRRTIPALVAVGALIVLVVVLVVVARRPGTTVTVIETASKDRAEEVTGTVPGTVVGETTVPVETTVVEETTIPETTAPVVTAPPVVVTQPPVVVTQPPVVTTQAPTTTLPPPVVTVPQKPAPQIFTGTLNSDEQSLLGEMQAYRNANGLSSLTVESGLQQVSTAKNLTFQSTDKAQLITLSEIPTQLAGFTAVYGKGFPAQGIAGLWDNIKTNYGTAVLQSWSYVGVSVVGGQGGWYYATVTFGA